MAQVTTIGSRELHDEISGGNPVFLLDLRNPEEYQDWKIEGDRLESLNIPYYDLIEGDDRALSALPKDREITVVCAKGGASEYIAGMLVEKGFHVRNMAGGMESWSQFYHASVVAGDGRVKLIQFNRIAKGCLSYMVIAGGEALVLDPARHAEQYVERAQAEGVRIRTIVDSHLHADHISGARELAALTGATYYLSRSDAQTAAYPFEPLEGHSRLTLGGVTIDVLPMETPGHTPGSVSVLVDGRYLLSGDTLFVNGLGRPDLGGKAAEWSLDLYETLYQRLAVLGDAVEVLPSHYSGYQEINGQGVVGTTLGDLRQEHIRPVSREDFRSRVLESLAATPPNYEEIVRINRGEETVEPAKATELEIGPNRCAVHHSH